MAKKTKTVATGRINEPTEKLKALGRALEHIHKDFGDGSIMKLGDDAVQDVEVIPTGSIGLDVALGVGGYPRGR
ncbi:MAG: DNA recombination/repair protein RecA, partial [Muribaculaceae bacterium]|nr:DNA recombination/repair protein RecA [Muribaculaceae bacterium]